MKTLVEKYPNLNPYLRKENGSWKNWVFWLVEFTGTFLMVFMILTPAAFNFTSGAYGPVVANLWSTFAFRSFYVAFFIYVLVLMFRRVSSNFNPAVTIVHMIRKDDDLVTGIGKIVVQFLGAFAAAFFAQFLAVKTGNWNSSNSLDAVVPTLQIYDWWTTGQIVQIAKIPELGYWDFHTVDHVWWMVVVGMEALLTFLLLGSVFMGGKRVTYKGRPIVIFTVLFVIISIGGRTNNVALNPARLIAPAVVGQMYGGAKGSLDAIWMFLTGQMIAVALMSYIQLNPKDKSRIVSAPQTQGYWRRYIGWEKAKTKMTKSGGVVIDWDAYVVNELKKLANQFNIKDVENLDRDKLIKAIKREKLKLKNKNRA